MVARMLANRAATRTIFPASFGTIRAARCERETMKQLDDGLWILSYPLKMLGADLQRNVTVMQLASGQLVIHSTAPFSTADVTAISSRGQPGWLAEAMLHHDTYAREGRLAFPHIPYLAPAGFSDHVNFPVEPLLPPPRQWEGQVDVLKIEGNPSYGEHVFFHRASGTLVVADLAFNFPGNEPLWKELILRAAIGADHEPGMSRPFRFTIQDEDAFKESARRMMEWDFDRVIVGHGDPIQTGGKAKIASMLVDAGLLD